MFSEIDCGAVISFEYPAANYQGVRPRWEARRLKIEEVRRLDMQPLDPVTLELEPHLNRGKTLVMGWDYDRQSRRSFYAESMREVQVIPLPNPNELPPLYVTIEDDGRAAETIEIPDPRTYFCKHWANLHPDGRSVAVAIA